MDVVMGRIKRADKAIIGVVCEIPVLPRPITRASDSGRTPRTRTKGGKVVQLTGGRVSIGVLAS